jgi:hypothetical protein
MRIVCTSSHSFWFIDPDSRILPTAGGFEQSYKAAVDTDTMLVVATGLSQAANDKQQITADGGDVGRNVSTTLRHQLRGV